MNRPRIIHWLLSFRLGISISIGISASASGIAAAELTIPHTRLRLHEPVGWLSVPPSPNLLWRWRNPDQSAAIAVSTTAVMPEIGPAQAAQLALNDLEQLAGQFHIIDWNFGESLGGRVWSHLHYRHQFAGEEWEQEVWITIEHERQITVALGARPVDFPRNRQVLIQLLSPLWTSAPVLTPAQR